MTTRLAYIIYLLFTIGCLDAQQMRCPINRWAVSNRGAVYIDDIGNKAIYGNFTNFASSEYVNDGNLYLFGNLENRGFIGDGEGSEHIMHCDTAETQLLGSGTTEFNKLFVNNRFGVNLETDMRIKTSLTFQDGIIRTNRTIAAHRVTFRVGSSYQAANDQRHINGTVRKQGSGPFTFPTGDGDHMARVGVVGENNFDLFVATYYSQNLDSSVWARPGNFLVTNKAFNVFKVQDKEFWTLTGGQSTRITLHWNRYSDVARLTSNFRDIIVVGWDGTKWVNLGQTSVQEAFGSGSVSSNRVIPNNYKAFTLGVADTDGDLYVDSRDPAPLDPCIPDPQSEACLTRMCLALDISVYLEGPMTQIGNANKDQMQQRLYNFGYLPGMKPKTVFGVATKSGHPYGGVPWIYDGREGQNINEFQPANSDNRYIDEVIDWVMVSLRTSIDASTTVCRKPALLTNSGKVVFTEFFACCDLMNTNYYIVVEHRNHLPIMTPQPVSVVNGVLSFDFRANQSYVRLLGSGQKLVAPGVYAMYAGNGDQHLALESPKDINANDIAFWNADNGKHSGYYFQDYDLNGDVNVQDKTLWLINNGIFSDVDIR